MKIDISKYESLQQLADDFPEQKELLKAFQKLDHKLRFDRPHCAVCDKILSSLEKSHHTYMDFNFCCDEHGVARSVFQADMWAKRNGLNYDVKPRFQIL